MLSGVPLELHRGQLTSRYVYNSGYLSCIMLLVVRTVGWSNLAARLWCTLAAAAVHIYTLQVATGAETLPEEYRNQFTLQRLRSGV